MEIPVVGADIRGTREAVLNGKTGFLVQSKNSDALIEPLKKLILDKELRIKLGRHGRERMEEMFDSKDVINAIVVHRLSLLNRS